MTTQQRQIPREDYFYEGGMDNMSFTDIRVPYEWFPQDVKEEDISNLVATINH